MIATQQTVPFTIPDLTKRRLIEMCHFDSVAEELWLEDQIPLAVPPGTHWASAIAQPEPLQMAGNVDLRCYPDGWQAPKFGHLLAYYYSLNRDPRNRDMRQYNLVAPNARQGDRVVLVRFQAAEGVHLSTTRPEKVLEVKTDRVLLVKSALRP